MGSGRSAYLYERNGDYWHEVRQFGGDSATPPLLEANCIAVSLDASGRVCLGSPGSPDGGADVFVLGLDSYRGLVGTVNRGRGRIESVLRVNRSAGGSDFTVEYDVREPVFLEMNRPSSVPASQRAPFAGYVWFELPRRNRVSDALPLGMGMTALPTPFSGRSPQPTAIWNNAGRFHRLGFPTLGSVAAPSRFFYRERLSSVGRFFVQGIIFDPGSSASVPASVTNGVIGVPVFRP